MTKQEITEILKNNLQDDGYRNGNYQSVMIDFQGYKVRISCRGIHRYARWSYHIFKKGTTISQKQDLYAEKDRIFAEVADILIETLEAEVEALLLLDNGISQSLSFREPNDNT